MRNKALDEALAQLSRSRVPTQPSNFEANVWRTIRERHTVSREPSILECFFAILFRPAGAFSAAVVTLAVAVTIGSFGNADSYSGSISEMSVFAATAPALPSTLIGRSK